MTPPNIFNSTVTYDENDPQGYRSGSAHVGALAGGKALNVRLYELPAEQSSCPYHYEFEEEWLLVLSGSPTLRAPDGEHELGPGDLVCFPPGPAGAHKLTNRTDQVVRALMFSSAREPAVAVYPDSDKIGAWSGNEADTVMVRRADGRVDYWDGER